MRAPEVLTRADGAPIHPLHGAILNAVPLWIYSIAPKERGSAVRVLYPVPVLFLDVVNLAKAFVRGSPAELERAHQRNPLKATTVQIYRIRDARSQRDVDVVTALDGALLVQSFIAASVALRTAERQLSELLTVAVAEQVLSRMSPEEAEELATDRGHIAAMVQEQVEAARRFTGRRGSA